MRLAIETSDFAGTVHLRGAADHEEHVLGQVRLAFLPRALEAAVSIAMINSQEGAETGERSM